MDRILAWSGSSSSPQPTTPMALAGGCRFLPQDPAPARSYAGQPQGQHSDEGSDG
jgi:hypothetical protein